MLLKVFNDVVPGIGVECVCVCAGNPIDDREEMRFGQTYDSSYNISDFNAITRLLDAVSVLRLSGPGRSARTERTDVETRLGEVRCVLTVRRGKGSNS